MVECLLSQINLSYIERIMTVPFLPKFKLSQVDMYDKSRDLVDHLENFKAHIMLNGFPDEVACRAFPLTLKGTGREWFSTLKPRTVNSFKELAK